MRAAWIVDAAFPEDSMCHAYSINWYEHVMKELQGTSDLKQWMAQLPRRIEFSFCGRRFAVVHGSPAHIAKFVWPSTSDDELAADIELLPDYIDGVISGHSGIPFARFVPMKRSSPKLWLNAGVIGMPANDGTSRGWFAILTPRGNDIEVSIKALDLEAKEAADAIYATNFLNRGYADALLSGTWPSHDILPLEEQMSTNVPLSESSCIWKASPRAQRLSFASWSCSLMTMAGTALLVSSVFAVSRRLSSSTNA